MVTGKLSSWPAPPSEWIGHTMGIRSVSYSPNGLQIVSGSNDTTIRIWDAETGAPVGNPLEGHTDRVFAVAYSPNGQHIVSGSDDKTIRIWDAETGAAVGNPLEGHTDEVLSVAYSSDGRRIISGSRDKTIKIWDAETGSAVGNPLDGHTRGVGSVTYSPDGRHIVSGSWDKTIRIWDAETGAAAGRRLEGETAIVPSAAAAYSPNGQHSIYGSNGNAICVGQSFLREPPPSCYPLHARLCSRPDSQGWVKNSDGGLLYWVPLDCRIGLHSPALITIPLISAARSASLDFEDFAFGTAWTQIFNSAQI